MAQPLVQGGEDVLVLELAVGDAAVADLLDDQAAVLVADRRDFEVGHPLGQAVDAGDPLLDALVPQRQRQAPRHDLVGQQAGGGVGVRLAALAAAQHQAAEADFLEVHHAPVDAVVLGALAGAEVAGEEFAQPVLLDARDVVELDGERAALHLDDLRSDEQARRLDVRVLGQVAAVAAGQAVDAAAGTGLDAEVVAERGEQRFGQSLGGGDLVVDRQLGALGQAQELVGAARGLARGEGVQAEAGAGLGVEIQGVGADEGAQQGLELRQVARLPEVLVFVRGVVPAHQQDVAPLGDGGAERGFAHAAELGGGEQHAREARVQGEAAHLPAQGRDGAGGVGGAEVVQQQFGACQGGRRGRLEPGRILAADDDAQGQQRLAQVEPLHFRRLAFGAQAVVALRPQAHADAGAEAAGAAGALLGAGPADLLHGQGVDAAARVVAGHAGEARIDHGADAFDGQRGFGDVGADDDLRLLAGRDGGVLVLRRQFAVQGDDAPAAGEAAPLQGRHGLADLVGAGHEHQDVAREAGRLHQRFTGARRLVPDRLHLVHPRFRGFLVAHFDREGAAFGLEQLAGLHELLQRARHQGGGHDDDLQVGAARALQLAGEGEHKVAVEVALVKLVDDDAADVAQFGVVEQQAQHDAFGDVDQAGVPAGDVVEAHLIADFLAEPRVAFLGHPLRQHARGDAARLQDDAALARLEEARVEHELRHLGRFARTGRRLDQQVGQAGIAQAADHGVADFKDGQRGRHGRRGALGGKEKAVAAPAGGTGTARRRLT